MSDSTTAAVQASGLILVARVEAAVAESRLTLRPEAILKGSVPATAIEIAYPVAPGECDLATFETGQRVFVYLSVNGGAVDWPSKSQVFVLANGVALQQAYGGMGLTTEASMVALVRSVTGQYVLPAQNSSEGAGIDWGKTVLPLSIALLIVFGIGLVLMRVWHRIDPT